MIGNIFSRRWINAAKYCTYGARNSFFAFFYRRVAPMAQRVECFFE